MTEFPTHGDPLVYPGLKDMADAFHRKLAQTPAAKNSFADVFLSVLRSFFPAQFRFVAFPSAKAESPW
jgi:hypothetical protein